MKTKNVLMPKSRETIPLKFLRRCFISVGEGAGAAPICPKRFSVISLPITVALGACFHYR
jgi:hypothetical protein